MSNTLPSDNQRVEAESSTTSHSFTTDFLGRLREALPFVSASNGSERTEPAVDLPADDVYEALCVRRRRRVLRLIHDTDDSLTLKQISRAIAGAENGKHPDQLSDQEYKRVYVGLYQCHLGTLERVGGIECDGRKHEITPGEHTAGLVDVMEYVSGGGFQ